jgi:Co/Zn/Cd efflux system component
MSKKTNTLLFILGGTVFNVLITIICFFILLAIYSRFLYPALPENSAAWILPVIFVASIAASFFIYRQAVKIISKKVNMEEHFDPIFGRRQPPRKRD